MNGTPVSSSNARRKKTRISRSKRDRNVDKIKNGKKLKTNASKSMIVETSSWKML